MHSEKRAISLSLMVLRYPTLGSLITSRVKNSVRPNHLFDHNRDHGVLISYFGHPLQPWIVPQSGPNRSRLRLVELWWSFLFTSRRGRPAP
jgi:hypothetical protein